MPIGQARRLGDPCHDFGDNTAAAGPPGDSESLRAQLLIYARDFNKTVVQNQIKSDELGKTQALLQKYASDLNSLHQAEKRHWRELNRSYLGTVIRLVEATALRDHETGGHLRRIGRYAKVLAYRCGWSVVQTKILSIAAPLHDVGKIGIPDRVLHKEGPLNDEEWEMMKNHTVMGARLLSGSRSPVLIAARVIAFGHHERWDGSGYPKGLAGENIPKLARMTALLDSYDALRSERPYRKGVDHETACRILFQGDGRTMPRHFDPSLLKAFKAHHDEIAEVFREVCDPRKTPVSPASQPADGRWALPPAATATPPGP